MPPEARPKQNSRSSSVSIYEIRPRRQQSASNVDIKEDSRFSSDTEVANSRKRKIREEESDEPSRHSKRPRKQEEQQAPAQLEGRYPPQRQPPRFTHRIQHRSEIKWENTLRNRMKVEKRRKLFPTKAKIDLQPEYEDAKLHPILPYIIELHEQCRFSNRTLWLAVAILRKLASEEILYQKRARLYAFCCLSIAADFGSQNKERFEIAWQALGLSNNQRRRMIKHMNVVLNWDVGCTTPAEWFPCLATSSKGVHAMSSVVVLGPDEDDYAAIIPEYAQDWTRYILESMMFDTSLIETPPLVLINAASMVATMILKKRRNYRLHGSASDLARVWYLKMCNGERWSPHLVDERFSDLASFARQYFDNLGSSGPRPYDKLGDIQPRTSASSLEVNSTIGVGIKPQIL